MLILCETAIMSHEYENENMLDKLSFMTGLDHDSFFICTNIFTLLQSMKPVRKRTAV